MKYFFAILLSFFIFSNCHASTTLKATNDKIFDFEQYLDKSGEPVIRYKYTTNAVAESKANELINKRTPNSQTFKLDGDRFQTKFYSSDQFIKNGDTWFQVETATTTKKEWESEYKTSLIDKILHTARASSYFSTAGDGIAIRVGSSWADARGGAGNDVAGVNIEGSLGNQMSYELYRGFFPFNTADLPDGATITDASFNVFAYSGHDTANWALIKTTQTDPTSLASGDFDNLTLNSPAEGATRVNILSTDNAYKTFTLNATGKSWIDKTGYTKLGLRSDYDVDNTLSDTERLKGFRFSEYTGTASDPYLLITYTEGGTGGETTTTATTTDMLIENITSISTTTALTASTSLTVAEYKVPFLLYFFVLTALSFTLLNCFFFYTIIHKNKK